MPVLIAIGHAILKVLIALGVDLLTGKTFKALLYRLMELVTRRTTTKVDDEILLEVKKDWSLSEEDIHPDPTDNKTHETGVSSDTGHT